MQDVTAKIWVVAAVFAALIISTLLSSKPEVQPQTTAPPSGVEVRTEGTPFGASTSPTAVSTPDPALPPSETECTPSKRGKPPARLEVQVRLLLQAHYCVPPDASERSMRATVKDAVPAIAASYFKRLYFGVEETRRPENQARWEQQLTLLPVVHLDQLAAQKDAKGNFEVVVPVTVTAAKPSGEEMYRLELETTSTWQRTSEGVWMLLGLGSHGDEVVHNAG